MINSKERSKLLALANGINTTVFVGKQGLTESVLAQIDEMLIDHELIKIGVQKNADLTAKELIRPICEELGAEPVHAIGSKIIIYRYSTKEGIEHVDYKNNSSAKTEEKPKKEEKPRVLGRKTFEYKSTRQRSDRNETSSKNNRQSYSSQNAEKRKNGNGKDGKFTKTSRSSSEFAPYKKDGVTIYKQRIGKPQNLKRSNKK